MCLRENVLEAVSTPLHFIIGHLSKCVLEIWLVHESLIAFLGVNASLRH